MSDQPLPQGWFSKYDILEYSHLVTQIPDGGTLVEVGVWIGRSLCSVAPIIRDKHLRVVAVDNFRKDRAMGKAPLKKSQRETFEKNVHRFGIEPEVFEMNSLDAAKAFTGQAHMVFLDALHGYPDVKNDIEAWWPKTTQILSGHDFYLYGLRVGVRRAVKERFERVRLRGSVWSVQVA